MKTSFYLFCLFLFLGTQLVQAQCLEEEVLFELELRTDQYAQETTWELRGGDGSLILEGGPYQGQNNTTINEEACLPSGSCATFTINDTYGDGICCGYGQGYYEISLDGVLFAEGGDFGSSEVVPIGCAEGQVCHSAGTVSQGTINSADQADHWYVFSPDSSGQYTISTCFKNECNTAIWVYDECAGLEWDDSPSNALFYGEIGCAGSNLAQLNASLNADVEYYIRIGDLEDDCASQNIEWDINYFGPSDPTQAPSIFIGNTELHENIVASNLEVPWEILWGPDDHIWITEKAGRVLRLNPETEALSVILDIQNEVESGNEAGLLGMALHPDFSMNPEVYLVYTYLSGGIKEKLVSYQWDGVSLQNESLILDGIDGGSIHDGSRLLISPDNKIMMTTGDVGSGNLSQNLNDLNGKLLRINLDGSIPADNPIPDSYIYSYGHRNSQGMAYGPNGNLYASEHGAQSSDEFNLIEPNSNYGWPEVEGECNTNAELSYCDANEVREPLTEWSPCVAVNGLEYYTHEAIPELQGKMLMAVLGGFVQDPRISVLEFNAAGDEVLSEQQYWDDYGRIRDMCVNPYTGALYFATNGNSYPSSGPNQIIEFVNLEYVNSLCVESQSNVYAYNYNNAPYEIVKEKLTWEAAAECAASRGGKLIEIESQEEQDSLWFHLQMADIDQSEIIAGDGGGAPYVWLGGNDIANEGTWIWDGENDGDSTHFWEGQVNGTAIDGLYNNWGVEPDDFQGQDGLAIGLTAWVNGEISEWNDVDHENELYYIIEYPQETIIETGIESANSMDVSLSPNPFAEHTELRFSNPEGAYYSLRVTDINGKVVRLVEGIKNERVIINRGLLSPGTYLYELKGPQEKASGKFIVR